MKKKICMLISMICLAAPSLMAQGNLERQTPEERIKTTMEKMAMLNLDTATSSKTKVIITDFYNEAQKAIKEMRESGSMDREALMSKRKELAAERDTRLKSLFTEEQFKKWKYEIEPSLRPQRPQNRPN